MTKSSKLFRIIALAAIIEFSMTACGSLLPEILAQQGPSSSTQQPTTQQATLDKLTFTPNSIRDATGYNVAAANNSISGAVVIPNTYNGLPVTGFNQTAFRNITGITSVVIPDSITRLPNGAFGGCTGLTSVTIAASINSIEANVFNSCDNLTSITFLGSVANVSATMILGDLNRKHQAGGAGIYTRSAGGQVWTRTGDAPITVNTSLNGVWVDAGWLITFSGNTATLTAINTTDATWLDAINKGYVKVGDQYFRNISSTGSLTWSGQIIQINFNTSNRNVATGTRWIDCTITMSANGQTIDVRYGNSSGAGSNETWTRR